MDEQLNAIRKQAEGYLAANTSGAGSAPTLPTATAAPAVPVSTASAGQMQESVTSLLEKIRIEAERLMTALKNLAPTAPTAPSAPAAPSAPTAPNAPPLFTLPDLGKILDGLLPKPTPAPEAPKPAPKPKPEPQPEPKPEPKPKPSNPGGTYTVKKNDSLSKIAQRVLGDGNRWREIYNLNRDQLSNPNVIHPGMVLKLPGGNNHPAPQPDPAPQPSPGGSPHNSRNSWYISQYGSKWNTNEDVPGYDNGNCGPTSLTMVAKAFGKIHPNAAQADAAIEETRRRMGDGMNERSGTSVAGIARGASSYGLNAKTLWNANSGSIANELAKGRLVIVHGTVIKDDGRTYGGHYYVVTKIENGKAYLNDPYIKTGPRVVDVDQLMHSINSHFGHRFISVGPGDEM
jgi:LysM repeat protein